MSAAQAANPRSTQANQHVPKTWVDTQAGSPTGSYLVIDLTPSRIAVGEQPDQYTPPKIRVPRRAHAAVVSEVRTEPATGHVARLIKTSKTM